MAELIYTPIQVPVVDKNGYLTDPWRIYFDALFRQTGGINALSNTELSQALNNSTSAITPPVFWSEDSGGDDWGAVIPGPAGARGVTGQSGFGMDGEDGQDGMQVPANFWPQPARGTASFTNGAGAAVLQGFSSTGGTGASTYTLGDIVLALKTLGILAA